MIARSVFVKLKFVITPSITSSFKLLSVLRFHISLPSKFTEQARVVLFSVDLGVLLFASAIYDIVKTEKVIICKEFTEVCHKI